jgi:predicted DNA-binding transcriptional regulator YafY
MTKSLEGKGKTSRQNRMKRLLSNKSEESALSLTEITKLLNAEGFSVNRKTVERDRDEISSADFPLSETDSNPVKYFFNGELPQNYELVFDENQLQTIVLALESLKQMSPEVIKSLCQEVEDTLVDRLPTELKGEFKHLQSISNASPTILGEGGEIEAGVLQTVLYCLRKGKLFQCEYHSSEEVVPSKRIRSFAPLKLHFAGSPYLYVYDNEDGVIKMLRISRIHSIKQTESVVNKGRAREIKLDHVFGGYGKGTEKVIDYAITCTTQMATKFREQKIHSSQQIELVGKDLFKITFSLHDSLEVVRMLAQYGEWIRKIEPEEVNAKVRAIWEQGLKAS